MAQILNMKFTKFYRPVAAGNLPGLAFPATWKIPRVKTKSDTSSISLYPPALQYSRNIYSLMSSTPVFFNNPNPYPLLPYAHTTIHTRVHSTSPVSLTLKLHPKMVLFLLLSNAIFLGCPYIFPESLKFS